MEVASLKAQIQSGNLDNFYIFTGEEWYTQRLYLKQISKQFDGRMNSIDDAQTLYKKLSRRSIFERPSLYVLRDDAEIIKNPDIIDRLRACADKNVIILVLSNVDKRTKLYKMYKDSFVEFSLLERAVLKRHIAINIKLTNKHVDKLIDVCEGNYGRILLEIDKIKRYAQSFPEEFDDVDFDEYFERLLKDGTIYQPPYDAIFDFVDDVLMHDVKAVYESLDNCKRIGESTLALLSVLYTNAKHVLQVQSYDGDNLEKATGLTAMQIKFAKRRCNIYRTGDLVYMLQLIHEIEVGIKIGKIEESLAMDYLLVHIL